ncbi:hypothetical protein B0H19DRAFT_1271258 [Mycena capillaripes]|nr:hypothetical protein B0H19DRAFT_1271258 [Mycena capillaripes]
MNHHPLTVQELVDHCLGFLGDSAPDLKACALVSRSWVFTAQSHLFREFSIGMMSPFGAGSITFRPCARLWERFSQTLDASPRLIRHVRDLKLQLKPVDIAVFSQICSFPFTHVDNVFVWVLGDSSSAPTLRRMKLRGFFSEPRHFMLMWGQCSPSVDIAGVEGKDRLVPSIQTIEVLDLHFKYLGNPFKLCMFPKLAHLRIWFGERPRLSGVLETFAGISPPTLLHTITIIAYSGGLGSDSCEQLDIILANLPNRPTFPQIDVQKSTNLIAVECFRQLRENRWRALGRNTLTKLEMFPEMHIDIVLEVLRHLHPLDLLHLSRTTREFRALLHGPALDTIWRESFIQPLPPCHSDIAGRRWAHLLFGAYTCEECGQPNTLPDFAILRRLCTQCMRRLLNYVHRLAEGHSSVVRKLIPETCRSDGGNRYQSSIHRALISEARAVIAEYELLEEDKGLEPEGPAALATFVQTRYKLMRERQKSFARSDVWVTEVTNQSAARSAENLKKAQATVNKMLLAEGHDLRDINKAQREISRVAPLSGISRLSSKRWNKIRREVVPEILRVKQYRLWDERDTRVKVAQSAIAELLRTRPPSTWANTPRVNEIANFPEFRQLTDGVIDGAKNENVVLAPDDVGLLHVLATLPAKLDMLRISEQVTLTGKIPADPRSLDLATNVFTATPQEVDALDPQFVCDDCPVTQRGREIMGWRVCLQHALEYSPKKIGPVKHISSWSILSAEAATDARRREGQDPSHVDSIWLCNLCPAHFDHRVKRGAAVAHASIEHAIAHPTEGVHFIYDAGAHRSPRTPVFLSCGSHATEYRCNHCAAETPHIVKLLSHRAVMSHVPAKHGVVAIEKGYTKVERLLIQDKSRVVA